MPAHSQCEIERIREPKRSIAFQRGLQFPKILSLIARRSEDLRQMQTREGDHDHESAIHYVSARQ